MEFPHHINKYSALNNISLRLAEKQSLSSQQYINMRKQLAQILQGNYKKKAKSPQNPPIQRVYFLKRSNQKDNINFDSKFDLSVSLQKNQSQKHQNDDKTQLSQQKNLIRKYNKLKQMNECIIRKQKNVKMDNILKKQRSHNTIKIKHNKQKIRQLQKSVILKTDGQKNQEHKISIQSDINTIKKSPLQRHRQKNKSDMEKHGEKQQYISVVNNKYIDDSIRDVFSPKLMVRLSHKKNKRKKINNMLLNQKHQKSNQLVYKPIQQSYSALKHIDQIKQSKTQRIQPIYRSKSHKNGIPTNRHKNLKSQTSEQRIDSYEMQKSHNLTPDIALEQTRKIREARNLKKYINQQRIKLNQQRQHYFKAICDKNKQNLSILEKERSQQIMQKFNENRRGISLPSINLRKNKYYSYDEDLEQWKMNNPEDYDQIENYLVINHEPNQKIKKF